MAKHVLVSGFQLCLVIIIACSQVFAYEDQNNDGVIVRLCPPPGREYVMKPDSTIVMVCTGYPLRELFSYPDDWDVTRSVIDYFGYTSWILHERFTDTELASYFAQLNTWDLNFDLGVMAVKDLPFSTTGEQCYAIENYRWERFNSLGAEIASMTIDEPLSATVRGNLHGSSMPPETAISYAVRETADWLELTRADSITGELPIALIEAYPYLQIEGESIVEFVDSLQIECELRDIEGISALVIDYNWCGYSSESYWNGLFDIQEHCDSIGLPFSLIFWPARSWRPNDVDWDFYNDIMYQANLFFNVYSGSLDVIDVTAWDWIPRQMVPESYINQQPINDCPFTFAFLRFYDAYVADEKGVDSAHSGQNSCEYIAASISPNPARSNVVVRFSITDTEAPVYFEAFDLAGRVVRSERVSAVNQGTNSYTWDGCDNSGASVSTGVYFVRLIQNGAVSNSSRLLLMD